MGVLSYVGCAYFSVFTFVFVMPLSVSFSFRFCGAFCGAVFLCCVCFFVSFSAPFAFACLVYSFVCLSYFSFFSCFSGVYHATPHHVTLSYPSIRFSICRVVVVAIVCILFLSGGCVVGLVVVCICVWIVCVLLLLLR